MMAGKLIPEVPITQETAAVKTLIEFITGKPCEELPVVFKLADGAQLTRSNKGDVYYYTSSKACTCPGYQYRHAPCKHMRSLEGSKPAKSAAEVYQEKQRAGRAAAKQGLIEPVDSLMPVGPFKPVLE